MELHLVFSLLSLLSHHTVLSGGLVSQLKCYSNIAGVEMKLCEEEAGYTSCFTKFNPERQITGRGCSNKESNFLFEDDCETFQSRDKVEDLSSREEMAQPSEYTSVTETYCYCSYYLCNQSETTSPPNISPGGPTITLATLIIGLHSASLVDL